MACKLICGSVCLIMLTCTLSSACHLWPVEPLRLRRQVVQPTWLRGHTLRPSSANVHATPQALQEAAAIRAQIQHAIDEGTYAVADDTPQAVHPSSERPAAVRHRPAWPILNFNWPLPAPWPRLVGSVHPLHTEPAATTRAPRLPRQQSLLFV